MTPKFNALNAPPTAGKRGGRGSGRIMAEDYWIARDPENRTSEDYSTMLTGLNPGRGSDIGTTPVSEEDSPTRPTQLSSEGEGGGGVGQIGGRVGPKSRKEMSTGHISGTILSPNPKKVVA